MLFSHRKNNVSLKRQGFALLEVLISVVILTVGVVAMIQTLNMASHCLQENKHYWEAMNFSENQMFDFLRQHPLPDSDNNKISGTISQPFALHWETADFLNSQTGNTALNHVLRKIIFHVRWGPDEKKREVQIVTGMLQPEK